MCGRYALTLPPDAVRSYMRYPEMPNFPPRGDIRPTQPVAVVRNGEGGAHFQLMRWGFIPGFVKDMKTFPLLINARAETAFEKPSFRNAMRRRRCLLPASAWYEWQKLDEKGRSKQVWRMSQSQGGMLAFAGLHETWCSADGSEIDTVAILTTSANAALAPIHERMPVIVPQRDHTEWLDITSRTERIAALLRPLDDDTVIAEPVSGPGRDEIEA